MFKGGVDIEGNPLKRNAILMASTLLHDGSWMVWW